MEAKGQIRGGRFVRASMGEQFALPEAVPLLRTVRRADRTGEILEIPAGDPLNLAGIVLPGPRLSTLGGGSVRLRDGVPVEHAVAKADSIDVQR
jgi:ATP-dependent Lhr-like helicase